MKRNEMSISTAMCRLMICYEKSIESVDADVAVIFGGPRLNNKKGI